MLVTGKVDSSFWASPGSHEFVYYPELLKETPSITLCMEKAIFSPLSVFVVYDYLQHRSQEYIGSHRLEYHPYFFSSDVQLKGLIAFS